MNSPQERRNGPGGESETVSQSYSSSSNKVPEPTPLTPLEFAVLRDVFLLSGPGRAAWYLRRARDFENAKPKPGDFHGNATREQLSARWRWADEVARAFRAKAEAVLWDEEFDAMVRDFGRVA